MVERYPIHSVEKKRVQMIFILDSFLCSRPDFKYTITYIDTKLFKPESPSFEKASKNVVTIKKISFSAFIGLKRAYFYI